MAINYPTSLDTLTNPTSGQGLNSPSHATQHADANDAIEALEAKVGANSSAVTTSHDYKLGEVTGSDKAVGKTATQTLTNKTLTSPAVNLGSDATGDMYYRNSGGALTRLPIGTSGQILNTDGTGIPAWVANPAAADSSTTVKGVVEEATQAEVDAGTTAGGTSARLFQNPSTIRAKLLNTGVLDTGSANAVAIAPSPAITAYAAYQEFTFKAAATNTGATTINVNSLGTKNIFYNGAALVGGEILVGVVYKVAYDGTQFNLVSPSSLNVLTHAINTDETQYSYYTYRLDAPSTANGWSFVSGAGATIIGGGANYSGFNSGSATTTLFGPANSGSGQFDFNTTKILKIKFTTQSGSSSYGQTGGNLLGIGIANTKADLASTAATTRRIAIVFGASGACTAVCANGTSVTTAAITYTSTAKVINTWAIVHNPVTPSVKFYLNGTVVATITTNVPTTDGGATPPFGIANNSLNIDLYMTHPVVSIQQ